MASVPVLSVWPSISKRPWLQHGAKRSSVARPSGVSSALSVAKSTSLSSSSVHPGVATGAGTTGGTTAAGQRQDDEKQPERDGSDQMRPVVGRPLFVALHDRPHSRPVVRRSWSFL